MFPEDGSKSYPHHLGTLREYAASSIKHIMGFAQDMETYTATLPDDLKPTTQALTNSSMQVLTGFYVELLTFFSEQGVLEITRASGYGVPSVKEYLESVSQTESLHFGRDSTTQSPY